MSENVYQIDFNKPESVHFIGIGGISMSGLAEILMDEGFTVSGSDAHRSELTDNLEARGAKVYIGQDVYKRQIFVQSHVLADFHVDRDICR